MAKRRRRSYTEREVLVYMAECAREHIEDQRDAGPMGYDGPDREDAEAIRQEDARRKRRSR